KLFERHLALVTGLKADRTLIGFPFSRLLIIFQYSYKIPFKGDSMSNWKVLVTDYTWPSTEPEAQELAEAGASLILAKTGKEEELLALVPEADAILTCFEKVTPAVVRAGKKLQVIGRYGIGVDNIAVDEATQLGIPVTNTPGYCVHEV